MQPLDDRGTTSRGAKTGQNRAFRAPFSRIRRGLAPKGNTILAMDSALFVHRLHFAFTITYHYLFPQLTMGLSLLIVILKTAAWRTGDAHYDDAVFRITISSDRP